MEILKTLCQMQEEGQKVLNDKLSEILNVLSDIKNDLSELAGNLEENYNETHDSDINQYEYEYPKELHDEIYEKAIKMKNLPEKKFNNEYLKGKQNEK